MEKALTALTEAEPSGGPTRLGADDVRLERGQGGDDLWNEVGGDRELP